MQEILFSDLLRRADPTSLEHLGQDEAAALARVTTRTLANWAQKGLPKHAGPVPDHGGLPSVLYRMDELLGFMRVNKPSTYADLMRQREELLREDVLLQAEFEEEVGDQASLAPYQPTERELLFERMRRARSEERFFELQEHFSVERERYEHERELRDQELRQQQERLIYESRERGRVESHAHHLHSRVTDLEERLRLAEEQNQALLREREQRLVLEERLLRIKRERDQERVARLHFEEKAARGFFRRVFSWSDYDKPTDASHMLLDSDEDVLLEEAG